jgi:hypothetical protein
VTVAPCIYCRRVDVPRTREHVLQAALGAVATLPSQVCAECNSAFSAIDKSFLEAVDFYHTGENMLRGLGLGRAVLDDGTNVTARLRTDGKGEYPPQLYESTATEWKFLGHREEDFHQMLRELAEPTALTIKTKILKREEGVPRLAILRSAPNIYLIQGVERDAVERFATEVKTNGMRPEWTNKPMERSSSKAPPILYDTSLSLDTFCRAMAKVAINFVCYRLGVDVALSSEFDRVRRFARHGEGAFMDFAVPTVLNHTLVDAAAPFVTAEHHALILHAGPAENGSPCEVVFVAIRGKTIGRLDLTRDQPALPAGTWLLTRFNGATRSVEDLTLPDDMYPAVLNSAAIGLQDVWPRSWPCT